MPDATAGAGIDLSLVRPHDVEIAPIRIGADDRQIARFLDEGVADAGRYDDHVAGGQADDLASFTAELNGGGALDDAQTSCAVEW